MYFFYRKDRIKCIYIKYLIIYCFYVFFTPLKHYCQHAFLIVSVKTCYDFKWKFINLFVYF